MGLDLLHLAGPIVSFAFSNANNGSANTNLFLDPTGVDQTPQGTESIAQRVAGVDCSIWRLVGSYNLAGTQSCVMTLRVNGVSQASTATTVGPTAGSVVTDLATGISVFSSDLISILFKFAVADASASVPMAQVVGVVADSLTTINLAQSVALAGTTDSDASTFGLSDPTLITSPAVVAYVNAVFTADVTLTGGKISKIASHAGTGGTNWDLTDSGDPTHRPSYTSGVSYDYDGVANSLISGTTGNTQTTPHTTVLKAKFAGTSNLFPNTNMYLSDGTTQNQATFSNNNSGTNRQLAIFNGAVLATANNIWTVGTPFKVSAVYNNTNSRIAVAGQLAVAGAAGNTSSQVGWELGGVATNRVWFFGSIYWAIKYAGALTPGQELALFNGIA